MHGNTDGLINNKNQAKLQGNLPNDQVIVIICTSMLYFRSTSVCVYTLQQFSNRRGHKTNHTDLIIPCNPGINVTYIN